MIYDGIKFVSILDVEPSLKDRTLVFNGVSKSFAMTGWRVGFVAGPKDIIKAINKIQSQSTSHTSSISQYAAEEALNGSLDFLAERNATFKTRRVVFVDALCPADNFLTHQRRRITSYNVCYTKLLRRFLHTKSYLEFAKLQMMITCLQMKYAKLFQTTLNS